MGIEFSQELADSAQRNLSTYRNPAQICRKISVVVGDAVDYEIPDVPLVLFFANPFDAAVMMPVIDNLRRSLKRNPRLVTVLYNNPKLGALWETVPGVKLSAAAADYAVYQFENRS